MGKVPDATVAPSIRLLEALSRGYTGDLAVRFWDDTTWQLTPGVSRFVLVLKHPGALRAMFWPFDRLAIGESYIFGDFDIEGDIFAFVDWLRHLVGRTETATLGNKLGLMRLLMSLPSEKNPRVRAKAGRPTGSDRSRGAESEAIAYSYDPPGEIFELFLDRAMQYTCGYFADANESLDAAQERKLDTICRKLRLKPGERFVDFGCGWGGLVIHAAKHFGVEAVGVTLAGEQARWAQRAIAAAGLTERVKIVLTDYRDFRPTRPFDKAASVGMSEHVGNTNLPLFLRQIFDALRPGGAYLHHCITLRPHTPYPRWTAFARKYVFPNGDIQTLPYILDSAAKVGFEVRDVESLREHYVLTLKHWVRNLEAHRTEVLRHLDEVGYRVFHLYMAGATMGFRRGIYNLNQCLVVKPDGDASGLPLSRADWYASRGPS